MEKLLAFLWPNQTVKRTLWFRLGHFARVSDYPSKAIEVEFTRSTWRLFDDGQCHIEMWPYVAQANEQWHMKYVTHLPR